MHYVLASDSVSFHFDATYIDRTSIRYALSLKFGYWNLHWGRESLIVAFPSHDKGKSVTLLPYTLHKHNEEPIEPNTQYIKGLPENVFNDGACFSCYLLI